MELVLGILLLFTFIMLVTIQTTHKSTINQKLIERRRSEYLHALAIAQNHPNNPAYRNLAIACGQAYAAVEDTTIFDESLLAQDLMHHYDVNAQSFGLPTTHFAQDKTHPSREFIRE